MYKRAAEGEPGGSEPPAKKIVFQPLQLGAITNLEELDFKTLQFQNRYRYRHHRCQLSVIEFRTQMK
jgi:hypothetical protein